jgi:hypothetical protein
MFGLESLDSKWEIDCLDIDTGEFFFYYSMPPFKWAADPFLFEYLGEIFLFVELFDEHHKKGSIAFCKFKDGCFSEFILCLNEDFHLSFPRIVEFGGKIFLTVESSTEPGIRIYVTDHFPFKWTLYNIFDESQFFLDPLIIIESGQILIISTIVSKNRAGQLKLFEVQSLENSALKDSPSNPISRIPSNSRNGGLFHFREKLIRVSQQEFLGIYGYNLKLNEVVRPINFVNYKEKTLPNIFLKKPNFARQFHTLNRVGKYLTFDFKR